MTYLANIEIDIGQPLNAEGCQWLVDSANDRMRAPTSSIIGEIAEGILTSLDPLRLLHIFGSTLVMNAKLFIKGPTRLDARGGESASSSSRAEYRLEEMASRRRQVRVRGYGQRAKRIVEKKHERGGRVGGISGWRATA